MGRNFRNKDHHFYIREVDRSSTGRSKSSQQLVRSEKNMILRLVIVPIYVDVLFPVFVNGFPRGEKRDYAIALARK